MAAVKKYVEINKNGESKCRRENNGVCKENDVRTTEGKCSE